MRLFERHQESSSANGAAWNYSDPTEASFAFDSLLWGLPLPLVDDWLEEAGWLHTKRTRANRDRIVAIRKRAIEAHARGSREEARAWWESLAITRQYYSVISRLLPLARHGVGVDGRRKLPSDAELVAEYEALLSNNLDAKAVKARLQRKYGVSRQAFNDRLRKWKASPN